MTAAALTEIRFYGPLRPLFGKSLRLAVGSPAEAIRAMCAVLPGFRRHLAADQGLGYRLVVGKSPLMGNEEILHPTGRQVIKFVPVVSGAGSGVGKIFAGIALIALAVFTGGAGAGVFAALQAGELGLAASAIAFNIGVSMALGGAAQLLAGNPAAPKPPEAANNQPSYAFNGAVNTTAQGNPVPVCYGRLRIGSQVISSGLSSAPLAI